MAISRDWRCKYFIPITRGRAAVLLTYRVYRWVSRTQDGLAPSSGMHFFSDSIRSSTPGAVESGSRQRNTRTLGCIEVPIRVGPQCRLNGHNIRVRIFASVYIYVNVTHSTLISPCNQSPQYLYEGSFSLRKPRLLRVQQIGETRIVAGPSQLSVTVHGSLDHDALITPRSPDRVAFLSQPNLVHPLRLDRLLWTRTT
jgi:hypothetical protein